MSKSTTIRTGTAAPILVGALGFGPGLAASDARHPAARLAILDGLGA